MKFKVGDRIEVQVTNYNQTFKKGYVWRITNEKTNPIHTKLDGFKYLNKTHYHGFYEKDLKLDQKSLNIRTLNGILGITNE